MIRWPVIILLVGLLAACAGSAPVPEDRFYQIDTLTPEQAYAAPVLRGGLDIDYTQADPLRSGRAVLYSESDQPLQLERYHYAFWVDQPPRMLNQALVDYLRTLGVADRLVAPGQRGQAAYHLHTQLLKFEQWRQGKVYGVEISLQASLRRHPDGPVFWTRVYRERRQAGGSDMHASAMAMQEALAGILQRLGDDLGAEVQVR